MPASRAQHDIQGQLRTYCLCLQEAGLAWGLGALRASGMGARVSSVAEETRGLHEAAQGTLWVPRASCTL